MSYMPFVIFSLTFHCLSDCKAGADIMYSGAAALGCQPFLDAQEKACSCDVTSSSSNKSTTESKRNAEETQKTPSASKKYIKNNSSNDPKTEKNEMKMKTKSSKEDKSKSTSGKDEL